jgi:hypothetical protein
MKTEPKKVNWAKTVLAESARVFQRRPRNFSVVVGSEVNGLVVIKGPAFDRLRLQLEY